MTGFSHKRRGWSEAPAHTVEEALDVRASDSEVLANVGDLRGVRFEHFLRDDAASPHSGAGYYEGISHAGAFEELFLSHETQEVRDAEDLRDELRFRRGCFQKALLVSFGPFQKPLGASPVLQLIIDLPDGSPSLSVQLERAGGRRN